MIVIETSFIYDRNMNKYKYIIYIYIHNININIYTYINIKKLGRIIRMFFGHPRTNLFSAVCHYLENYAFDKYNDIACSAPHGNEYVKRMDILNNSQIFSSHLKILARKNWSSKLGETAK